MRGGGAFNNYLRAKGARGIRENLSAPKWGKGAGIEESYVIFTPFHRSQKAT